MIGRFKFELQPKYPHLSEKETEIWNRFLQKFPKFCDRVDYDITVGEGPEVPKDLKEEWKRNAFYLGSYKIDAVGYAGPIHFVFEAKRRAGPSALGQLMGYMFLYQEMVGTEVEVEPVLVTDLRRPDMEKLCKEHDIDYYVV